MATATKIQDAKALPSVLKQPPLFTLEQLKSILKLREGETGPLEALLGGDVKGQLTIEDLLARPDGDLRLPDLTKELPTKGMRTALRGSPKLAPWSEAAEKALRRSRKDPELREFLAKLKKSEAKAGGNPTPDYIHRELPDTGELSKSPVQAKVDALMEKFRGASKRSELAVLDAAASKDFSVANKLAEAILNERPDITAEQFRSTMPHIYARIQWPRPGQTLAQAVAQKSADYAEGSAAETLDPTDRIEGFRHPDKGENLRAAAGTTTTRPKPKPLRPIGSKVPSKNVFMAQELEDARKQVRKGSTPILEKLPAGKAPPEVDKRVAKVLAKRDLLKKILPAGADNKDAWVAALARAKERGEPPPTFRGALAALETEDQELATEDVWADEVRSGRRGQSEAERLLRRPPGPTSELREVLSRGRGLPPADPKRLEEYIRLLTKKSPEFKGQKVQELLGPGERGKKALGALMHRDAVVGDKLKRAIELVRAGEPEAAAMAGLGKQLQQILRMFITKL